MSTFTAAQVAELVEQARSMAVEQKIAEISVDQQKLDGGTFFAGYGDIWEKTSVPVKAIEGRFDEICRDPQYSQEVDAYSELLAKSESEKQRTTAEPYSPISPSLPLSTSDSRRSGSQQKKKKKKKNKGSNTPDSVGDDTSFSELSSGIHSTSTSLASNKSQSNVPDFAGGVPSTRAHMIPNRQKYNKRGGTPQTCYKYYGVICQSVLGFSTKDSQRLERIAFEMADCSLNFLRAPVNHGPYLDENPCWILVPACSFNFIKTWTPGEAYPILAVANGCTEDITTEDAYRFLSSRSYNDRDFSERTAKTFKRSKCTKGQLDEATENLRKMVLAMAETLVGRNGEVKPYESLLNSKGRGFKELPPEKDQWNKEHYDIDLFEATMLSVKNNGVRVPKLERGLEGNPDLDGVELLVCHLNPDQVDLYPDPILLLVKAAINWSWYCDQKLLPACGSLNIKRDDGIDGDKDEEIVPTTPVPECIELRPTPGWVTPD